MATVRSTRQQILFHHPTTHIYHIYYEDLILVGGDHDLEIFRVKNRSGLHNKILNQLVKKLNVPRVIRSSSPVTNPSGELTNIILT